MPRRKPAPSASAYLRRSIASAAARLMAEDGISDYGVAKRKAARHMGASEGESLPTNEEVAAELHVYQEIFQEDEQRERLHELRTTALAVMAKLDDFHPCLTGAVLDGTAGRHSSVELELFADSSKDVEIALLSGGISYDIDEMHRRGPDSPETRLRLDWEGVPVQLLIYPPQAERDKPRNSHTGRSHLRARAAAVASLLQSAEPTSS